MKALPLLLTLAATAALAATPLEAVRQTAAEARAQVDGLRREQLALRGELGALSGRIEALKGRRGGAGELDTALKQSQALSSTLTGLAQSLVDAERRAEQAHLALLGALSGELTRLRGLFDAAPDRARRAQLLGQMRAVRAEQERVRLALPPALVPAPPAGATAGDDPEDLLEQADALRDGEDRLRARLRQLEARLREAREERELQRRMDDFAGAEAIFDEQDRRLRLLGTATAGEAHAPPRAGPGAGPGSPTTIGDDSGIFVISDKVTSVPSTTAQFSREPAGDRRPQVGVVPRGGPESEEALEVEALEALRRQLEGQAHRLGQRAAELEQRARELR